MRKGHTARVYSQARQTGRQAEDTGYSAGALPERRGSRKADPRTGFACRTGLRLLCELALEAQEHKQKSHQDHEHYDGPDQFTVAGGPGQVQRSVCRKRHGCGSRRR